jgi:acetyl/propionyl-CoA carboxylase alpha subunit
MQAVNVEARQWLAGEWLDGAALAPLEELNTQCLELVGDMAQAGQIICIVEAMKVFNEIKTEVSGVIASIPAQNGQLVQKGDVLVRIKPV